MNSQINFQTLKSALQIILYLICVGPTVSVLAAGWHYSFALISKIEASASLMAIMIIPTYSMACLFSLQIKQDNITLKK